MRSLYLLPILLVLLTPACYEATKPAVAKKNKKPFVFKETIVTGKDTGMYSLSGFRRNNIADMLCQRWEIDNGGYDPPSNHLSGLDLFKDSTVLRNARAQVRSGRWHIEMVNQQPILHLQYSDGFREQFLIENLRAHDLRLGFEGTTDIISRRLSSDGLVHQNMYSDPFHPTNNQWRIRPARSERDSAIRARVKQCIRFYALYYRDNIRRNHTTISFKGLPEIFEWYSGGIGLPDRDQVSQSWIDCFYNKAQALKGYDILNGLILDYEFNWPKNAPAWVYETHSVLEQMYHKL